MVVMIKIVVVIVITSLGSSLKNLEVNYYLSIIIIKFNNNLNFLVFYCNELYINE